MRCSLLQCGAVWCSVLQCLAVSCNDTGTAEPTWGDIFESCFKAQGSKFQRLFCHVSVQRDLRALCFELLKELSEMSPHVGLAVDAPSKSARYLIHHITKLT